MSQLIRSPSKWLALAAVLPLALLIGLLALHQFRQEREALLAEQLRLNTEQHFNVQTVLRSADRQLARMEMRMRLSMEKAKAAGRPPLSRGRAAEIVAVAAKGAGGLEWRPALTSQDHGNLIAVPDLLTRPAADLGPVDAALDLLALLEVEARLGSLSSWSYFFSARGDFITILPGARLADFLAAAPQTRDVPDLIDYWLGYDVFRMGTPDSNPGRVPYWTPPYEDAGGAGRMVSHAMPVYDGERFLGIVGTDILLASLSEVLLHMDSPIGFIGLVGEKGDVLGTSNGRVAKERLVSAVATEGVPKFREVGGEWQLVQALAGTPFRLVTIVPDRDLMMALLPRLLSHILILCGAAASAFVLLALLNRAYVLPGIRLAAFAEASATGGNPAMPEMPRRWRRQADAIARAFSAGRRDREALAASEERYRTVVDTQTELIARHDPSGRTTFVNDAYCRQLGLSREAALAKETSDFDYIIAEDRPRHDAHIDSLTPENPVGTISVRSYLPHDREPRWEEWTNMGIFDAYGTLVEIQSIGRDVTDRMRAEEALEISRSLLADFLDNAPVAILARDREGRFTLVNPEAERRLRITKAQLHGRSMSEVLPGPTSEAMDRSARRVLETGETEIEERHHPEFTPFLDSTFIRFPLRGSDGGVTGVGIFVVDQTAQKATEAELVRQRDALHQSEKLAALGSLLAGVAHELNNPLSIVVGYAGMLNELAQDEPTRRRTREIVHAAERCSRIVRTFLAMARSKPAEKREADLDRVLDDVVELVAYGLRSNGVDVVRERDGAPRVLADVDQLHQVFMNVILNAQQAMMGVEGSRRLTIRTGGGPGEAVVELVDTGTGIDPSVAGRVFEPFFTTKPQGVGTGIGLSVSLGIVEAHGGTIALNPAPGGGTACRITLPSGVGGRTEPKTSPTPRPSRGSVLVVDDEMSITAYIVEALEADGVDAVAVNSAAAALEAAAARSFDAVLTDLRMPDMAGDRLAQRLLAANPALRGRIVLMTGDALSAAHLEIDVATIEKPVDLASLRATLAPLLDFA